VTIGPDKSNRFTNSVEPLLNYY